MGRTNRSFGPRPSIFVVAIFVAIGGASAFGQTLMHAFSGPTAHAYGGAIAGPGDLNGDGVGDVVVRAATGQTSPQPPQYLSWRSSQDGAVLQTVNATGGFSPSFGAMASRFGDLNGDGLADVVAVRTYALFSPVAEVLSGAGASVLLSVPLGYGDWRAFGVGDFNSDGVPDFAVAQHGAVLLGQVGGCSQTFGSAKVYSGVSGATLFSTPTTPTFPVAIATRYADQIFTLGDVAGSVADEFAIVTSGKPVANPSLACAAPVGGPAWISLREGGTGAELAVWTYPWASPAVGGELAAAGGGDFDFDGLKDVVVAQKVDTALPSQTTLWTRSAATGAVFATAQTAATNHKLVGVVVVGDVDGDLVPDFVVSETGALTTYSGATCAALSTIAAPIGATFGAPVVVGDLNLDGVSEFAVAATFAAGPNNEVRVYSAKSLAAAFVVNVGSPCGGASSFTLSSTPPILGATATLGLTGGPAFAPAIVVLSGVPTTTTAVPSGPSFGSTCPLLLDLPSMFVLDTPALSSIGDWSLTVGLPSTPALLGQAFALNAAYALAGGGIGLSNGVIGIAGY
jgi:hypothetical protein